MELKINFPDFLLFNIPHKISLNILRSTIKTLPILLSYKWFRNAFFTEISFTTTPTFICTKISFGFLNKRFSDTVPNTSTSRFISLKTFSTKKLPFFEFRTSAITVTSSILLLILPIYTIKTSTKMIVTSSTWNPTTF